ncbi:SRPBCC family protein [Actinomadura kijaniata]|uniref:SRPBCC family protein n=1 Tax=Actinomadura kijaniata TaxID=46161 RepID=UPI000830871A|nr:SRPBCC family protein [Actinomadura kijaniata]
MPYEIEATAASTAAPEVVFKHLAVAEAWSEWGSFPTRARRERAGDEHPNGVGAVRRIPPARERVVLYEPPRRYGYVALSGLPVREYRAEVTLTPHGLGTQITWRGAFEPLVPGTAGLVRVFLGRLLRSFARRVAYHAEHCEPGCPARLPDVV